MAVVPAAAVAWVWVDLWGTEASLLGMVWGQELALALQVLVMVMVQALGRQVLVMVMVQALERQVLVMVMVQASVRAGVWVRASGLVLDRHCRS